LVGNEATDETCEEIKERLEFVEDRVEAGQVSESIGKRNPYKVGARIRGSGVGLPVALQMLIEVLASYVEFE